MKKSLLLFGLLSTILFSCKNNSEPSKEQEGIVTAENTSKKSETIVAPPTENQRTDLKGFKTNIEKEALENTNFRKVLYTSNHLQLVLMSLKPGEEIGAETHKTVDQFFRIESGKGKCIINGNEYDIANGDVIVVPAGSKHNVINVDDKKDLKLYTIYTPPNHQDGIIRATKKDAEENEETFDGKTTE